MTIKMGIAQKIIVLFVALVVVSCGALSYFLLQHQQEMIIEEFDSRASVLLSSLAVSLELPLMVGNNSSVERIGESALGQKNVALCEIRDQSGRVLFKRDMTESVDWKEYSGAITTERVKSEGAQEDFLLGNAETFQETIGSVRLRFSLDSVNKGLRDSWAKAMWFLLFGTMFAAIFVTGSLRVLLGNPVKRLIQGASSIAAGDLNVKVQVDTQDEMGLLADAFNRMAVDLKKTTVSRDTLLAEVEHRKKAEAALLQSEKMAAVGQLAGGVAHDLNNQLTPVKGYIDMILSQTPPEDPNRPLLEEANMSVERCVGVVHQLVDFSHSSARKKKILSLPGVFQELKSMTQKFLPSTIHTEILCPADIYPVEGHETELITVFMNLAANSRDAMPGGGKLIFEAKNIHINEENIRPGLRLGAYVLVLVKDNGNGISQEIISRIFEPFFTTKKKGQGTGLGLAMVFKIIKDFGGWVDVFSQEGKGTTFQVYLPAEPGKAVQESGGPSAADVRIRTAKNETVLFADDEEMLRKMGKTMLEKMGYKVLVCSDGEEVVKCFRQDHEKIDAVVLDMTMPKLTGKQTLQKILEIDPKAKVILASGYTLEGTTDELLAFGAKDYLQKPYTIASLSRSLSAVLDRQDN